MIPRGFSRGAPPLDGYDHPSASVWQTLRRAVPSTPIIRFLAIAAFLSIPTFILLSSSSSVADVPRLPRPPASLPFYADPSFNLEGPSDGDEETLSTFCGLRPPTVTVTTPQGITFTSPSPALPLTARLQERLATWRAAPLASPDDWTALSNKTCDNESVVNNWNNLHRDRNREAWANTGPDAVRKVRDEMMAELERIEKAEGMRFRYSGTRGRRGVIFTAGNADTFERVIVILRLMRSYGTTLPAEVWHFENEEPTSAQLFEYSKYDCVAKAVEGLAKDEHQGRTKAFHIKGAAILQSKFEELLYLDSDSVPTKDVTPLFDAPGYKALGAMFWPDFWKDPADNAIWSILGVQCRDEFSMEAGQLLLNKVLHLDAVHLVNFMLAIPNYPFFFTLSDGDKDLFRYAFLALRKRWAVPGRHLASASWTDDNTIDTGKFCGHTMLQFDADGEPAFVHGNLLKRVQGAFSAGSVWGKTHLLSLPPLSAEDRTIPLTADHLANTDALGHSLAPTHSLTLRTRALAERNLRTFFHEGFRGPAYVLCVDSAWEPPVSPPGCPPNKMETMLDATKVGMVYKYWERDDVLKGFESAFFAQLGVPNGGGF